MPSKNCEVCGTNFWSRLSATRTCSTVCRNRLIAKEKEQRHTVIKSCAICGSEYTVTGYNPKKQTCSNECARRLAGSKTTTRVTMSCITCGKSFLSAPSQIASGGGKYCSHQCLYDRNAERTTRNCICCGKEFKTPPSHMRVKTCSTECGYLYFSGERRPNYVGATRIAKGPNGEKKVVINRWYGSKKNAERRAAMLNATPKWVDKEAIASIYEELERIEAETGIRHHVDHIVPLISKKVCGLHCQANLRVLPAFDNMSKGNRHWPDMW